MNLDPKFHHPVFTRSEVIVLTNKQTDAAENIQRSSLHYDVGQIVQNITARSVSCHARSFKLSKDPQLINYQWDVTVQVQTINAHWTSHSFQDSHCNIPLTHLDCRTETVISRKYHRVVLDWHFCWQWVELSSAGEMQQEQHWPEDATTEMQTYCQLYTQTDRQTYRQTASCTQTDRQTVVHRQTDRLPAVHRQTDCQLYTDRQTD